jgi:hypothetical protein
MFLFLLIAFRLIQAEESSLNSQGKKTLNLINFGLYPVANVLKLLAAVSYEFS